MCLLLVSNVEHWDACEGAYKRGNFSATVSPIAGLSLETRGGYINNYLKILRAVVFLHMVFDRWQILLLPFGISCELGAKMRSLASSVREFKSLLGNGSLRRNSPHH